MWWQSLKERIFVPQTAIETVKLNQAISSLNACIFELSSLDDTSAELIEPIIDRLRSTRNQLMQGANK